ncbi:hypothetical protein FOXG_22405 [Fusarium oxysporum f. sp. lycopersici 4287]|uniref:Uncharacterized protein n=1 Tax=Fusarium oxysporum f. sp. lycopersici (strain 4287 / CBS 123668 / FGSC 9935 / NRRL 34936) TaxID=426428 RepID=A0A0J9V027_FUSO4|nr:hypothetical protein FOXG_19459 [Fusarium oxysporum f. sp. lycopersici 4287]XP_018256913.1 hypothetical protein FOXG_22405 [Fusarium oxysporum f. sp. lycopersici 4287]KNB04924.1 hypothetical protein FOXG_19459 [Fusarium oxysporum f. sp. lycopersici 4287]KNB18868.1 hypothetical protein FOXG_22405 [Fusarium oxysporum f. sp. lycopersici 4287]
MSKPIAMENGFNVHWYDAYLQPFNVDYPRFDRLFPNSPKPLQIKQRCRQDIKVSMVQQNGKSR